MTRNRLLTFLLSVVALQFTYAQTTYSDDFEAYTSGSSIVTNNPANWRTWSSTTGGAADDAQISNEQAASGSNSIKIEAKVAAGGPLDLILKLGNTTNKGTIHAEWNMFVTVGKTGYFNFQSTTTPGTGWAMDFFFNTNGKMQVVAGSTTFSNQLDYPVGKWFKFAADIDVSNNLWQISIDDVCGATFRSALNTVAAVNFYANANNKYYIDDVSTSYDVDAITTFSKEEAGLLNLAITQGIQIANTDVKVAATLYNVGKDTITSIEYSITGLNGTQTETLSNLSLAPKRNIIIDIPISVKLADGDNDISLELLKVNGEADSLTCNNKIVGNTYAVLPATHRKVVLEEGTGTWCGWCPRGAVFLENISPAYDDYIIPIAVHNADIMTVPAYDNFVKTFNGFTGFPGMVVDRREVTDPSAALLPGLNYLREEPDATLTIGAKNGETEGTLDISVSTDFLKDIPNGYSMYITLVEHTVTGTTTAYNQSNFYANNAAGPMGGYESLPNPVPAAQMIYEHVARTFDHSMKTIGVATTGDLKVYNFNVAMDSTWDVEELKIVAVLLNENGQVSNANDATIEAAETAGFVLSSTEKILVNTKLNVYPNPAQGEVTVEIDLKNQTNVAISLIDVQGRIISTKNLGSQSGLVQTPVSLKGVTPGVYTALIRTNEGIATKKLVVQ